MNEFELHSFGDVSTKGVSSAVYAVIEQPSGTTQLLVTAKSRLAKRNLSVSRPKLVAAHMATNLLENICSVLTKKNYNSRSSYDSTAQSRSIGSLVKGAINSLSPVGLQRSKPTRQSAGGTYQRRITHGGLAQMASRTNEVVSEPSNPTLSQIECRSQDCS